MINSKALLSIVFAALCSQAHAEFTVKDLDQTAKDNELLFEGYTGGAAEMLVVTKLACPFERTFSEVAKVIKEELRKLQMEEMNSSAILFVAVVIKERFPCK